MINTINIVDEANYAEIMKKEIEPYLAKIRTEGEFTSFDGKKLHYEAHLIPNARGNVVIVHGFTEFAEKFREMAYYFIQNGFNAFALDNRGHGHSYRIDGDKHTVRLNKFNDYIEDLNIFATQIVKKQNSLPMYLYCHSMGGGIGARFLQVYPSVFEKAILSSPMIAAQTGVPIPLAKILMGTASAIGFKYTSVPTMCHFNPNATYVNSSDTSKARFDYFLSKKIAEPNYQTAGPAFGWVSEAVKLTNTILKDKNCKRVSAKVLVFQPESDAKVISSYQNKFVAKLPYGELVYIPNSKHEIFGATNDVLTGYLNKIFEFLS